MDEKPFIVACIPAYNEERTIAKVVLQAMKYVDRVVVCDDGSNDLTGEIAGRLGAEVIKHGRNLGYGAALRSLFRLARELNADILVTLDADGQHDADEIPIVVRPILDGEADVAIGSRFLSDGNSVPSYRRLGIGVITSLTRRGSYPGLTDAQSGFRAYGKRAIGLLSPVEQGMGASTEILVKAREAGLRVIEIPVRVDYRGRGSKINPIYHGLDVLLSTLKFISIRHPLLFYGAPGSIALIIALAFWLWTLRIFSETRTISTNIALIALGGTIVGLTLLTTAVILWVLMSVIRESK